jgi:hypothetical protein
MILQTNPRGIESKKTIVPFVGPDIESGFGELLGETEIRELKTTELQRFRAFNHGFSATKQCKSHFSAIAQTQLLTRGDHGRLSAVTHE